VANDLPWLRLSLLTHRRNSDANTLTLPPAQPSPSYFVLCGNWQGKVMKPRMCLVSPKNIVWAKYKAMSGLMLNKVRQNAWTAREFMHRPQLAGRTQSTMPCNLTTPLQISGLDLLARILHSNSHHPITYKIFLKKKKKRNLIQI
jgi:hypothetical protein